MAAYPDYIGVLLDSTTAEKDSDPSVVRTEMERGVPKQRILNQAVLTTLTFTALFQSQEDVASYDAWYFDTIGRIGWFDFVHPRTGQTLQARYVGGARGTLTPVTARFAIATRDQTIEYLNNG